MKRDRPRILVIDDDQQILKLMESVLREFEFDPLTAGSGRAGLTIIDEQRPDLILVDLHLSEISGLELISTIRSGQFATDVPVIILSGEAVSPHELAASGAVAAIQKPFDLTALIETLRSLLG